MGPVSYYYHPGKAADDSDRMDDDDDDNNRTPVVFVHGIGIGLISYILLIDELLESGRAIFLPEIPYVSGFRPWQSPHAVLRPAVVGSTMTAMLATHGHSSASWMGHSYGTSWLAYMVKYVPDAVASVLFLDPICFCLHWPRLTKQFVYMRPDPGTISYIIRTDVIVNWTIQRSFPWSWISLFVEQIKVPCAVFLSEKDALVPAEKVEIYLRSLKVPVQDFETAREQFLLQRQGRIDDSSSMSSAGDSASIQCTIFRGDGHGDWTERAKFTTPVIAHAVEVLCQQAAQVKSR
jgi:pimeloyl-ACP methyl ester carboxylesterase